MNNENKTKEQLIDELSHLRQRIAELQATGHNHPHALKGSLKSAEKLAHRDIEKSAELVETNEQLRQRNRELALLNRAGEAFNSSLDLDRVLMTVMEEVRHSLGITACSIWLTDSETDEVVCRQATGPQRETVHGWRLKSGQGIAGWVTHRGQSLIVSDTKSDGRYFQEVDQQTKVEMRSILSVPLKIKQNTFGVLQVLDIEVDRFHETDLTLIESLAATASVAIENARLYEQARQDAATKATLLQEVNHRVKNNLSAIIGLLYAERHHSGMEERPIYQAIMQDLIHRIQGIVTVHRLLSAAEWSPLPLHELATQIIRSTLQTLPAKKQVSVHVSPSALHVTPKQANSLAIVINELAVNSIKHALLNRKSAHIAIQIAKENNVILFEFRDDGPGYPEETLRLEHHNVGLYLIQSIICNDLHGEVSLYNHNGAVALIRLPGTA